MSNEELIVISESNAVELFSPGGAEKIIQAVREKVINVISDTSTAKGRSEIASRVHKIRRTKTAVEAAKKDLTRDLKTRAKAIDDEGKETREGLEKLIIEVMEPLQAWRDAETERIVLLKERLYLFEYSMEKFSETSLDDVSKILDCVKVIVIDDTWEEFKEQAAEAKPIFIEKLTAHLNVMVKKAEDDANLARLQKEDAERKKKEREEKIARDAAAEAEAKTKAVEIEKKRLIEQAKVDNAMYIKDAKAAEEKAEEQRKIDLAKIEDHKKQAKIQAEADKKEAIVTERKRVADEIAAGEKLAAKKAANKKHRKAVNEAALKSFINIGIDEETAKKVINAIFEKKIANIAISYY